MIYVKRHNCLTFALFKDKERERGICNEKERIEETHTRADFKRTSDRSSFSLMKEVEKKM